MRTYILRRLFQIVPTVLMITFVVFVMMRSVPGDPVVSVLGDAYTEEDAIKAREAYGLNKPLVVQYFIWLGKLLQGDWGASILSGRPVLQDVLIRLPVTLELIVLSMGVALVISIPAAIVGRPAPEHLGRLHSDVDCDDRGLDSRVLHRGPPAAALLDRPGGAPPQLGVGVPARHVPHDAVWGELLG